MLTKLEKVLLRGALRPDTRAWKWTMRFGYAVLLFAIIGYLYIFIRTGLDKALHRVILCVFAAWVFRTISAYQSLIRKLYNAIPAEGKEHLS